jgi:hypothetical protein
MRNEQNILFVLEGLKTEKKLVERLKAVFHFPGTVYTVNGNIYSLYQLVKDDPYVNIVDVLKEMKNSELDKEKLNRTFTDVFLVFDCDVQHTQFPREVELLSTTEIAMRNMKILVDMASRFNESTDPSRGKLLINYPMVESFRDCDDFLDMSYADASVNIHNLKQYKKIVGRRQLVRYHIKDFTLENFYGLIKMNILKLNKILRGGFEPMTYESFLQDSVQKVIAEKEAENIKDYDSIAVLNTLLFLPLDYFGNRNAFFDNLIAFE